MILMSPRSFAPLRKATSKATRVPRARKASAGLVEAGVVALIKPFLEFRGWRLVRTGSGLVTTPDGRRYRHGENGMADQLWLNEALSGHFWIETKREKGGELRPAQISWQRDEKARGATVLNVGHCTNAKSLSFDEFQTWYAQRYGRTS